MTYLVGFLALDDCLPVSSIYINSFLMSSYCKTGALKSSSEWDYTINRSIRSLVHFLTNIAILLTIVIPMFSYIIIVYWYGINFSGFTDQLFGLLVLVFYIFMGILFLLSPIYFYSRAKVARKTYRENIYSK